jgi:hypothetical protein
MSRRKKRAWDEPTAAPHVQPEPEVAPEPAPEPVIERVELPVEPPPPPGPGRWDPPMFRYLSGLLDDDLREKRLAVYSEAFEAERARIASHLDDPAFDDETRAEMRASFEIGDLVNVEILASTRPRRKPPNELRDAWEARLRERAESRGAVVQGGGAALSEALAARSSAEARTASILAQAAELDVEAIGPYNPGALALRLFSRLEELAHPWAVSWVAWLEDLSSVHALTTEPAPAKRRRRD